MLNAIQAELTGLVRSTWASDVQTWGERVALYREYAAGDHRAKLTPEMRAMLRVDDDRLDRFNANYCGLVTQAMSDRLTVTAIEGDDSGATEWAKSIMDANRFDTLQMDVHEAMLVDGDTFVIAAWSEAESRVIWAHEPAYDGDYGMIPVYDRTRRKLIAAVKIWYEGNSRFVNLYTPGAIKKYTWEGGTETVPQWALNLKTTEDWTDQQNAANGVPILHFRNRASTYAWHGESEIVNAIPLQDVLNRTITSMVMTSELSAFQILFAVGFDMGAAAAVRPGAVINLKDEVSKDFHLPFIEALKQATLVPFIEEAQFTIDQISSVTQTPILSAMGSSSSSGEALKQRETGLIGKVKRAQTRGGNAWEDTMSMSARMQKAYGKAPAESKSWKTVWQDASPRNESEVIKNAMLTRDVTGDRETLRVIGSVRGYDEKKIDALMAEKDEAAAKVMNQLPLPGFEMFGANTDLRQPDQPPAPAPLAAGNNAGVIDQQAIEEALALEAAG
jgi:hypothetical protein